MADCRDRQAGLKKSSDKLLQDFAFKILPHAARTMTPRKQQTVEALDPQLSPLERSYERRVQLRVRVRSPGVCVCSNDPTKGDQASQTRHKTPDVQAFARQHYVVCIAPMAIRLAEYSLVTKPIYDAPAERDLSR